MEVTAGGTPLEIEEFVAEDRVPAAVRQAAGQRLAGATNLTYRKRAVFIYEVEGAIDGRRREVQVLPTGLVIDGD